MPNAFAEHLGIDETSTPDEELRAVPGEEHTNAGGTVHGGYVATLLDASMGRAVRERLEEGQATVTAAMTITYLRPAKPGEEISTSVEVLQQGGSLVMVTGVATNPDGERVAHAVGTFAVASE